MANRLISELDAVTSIISGDEVEVQQVGKTVTKRATITQINSVEATARAAQDDVIEAGVGLNTNGTYPSLTDSFYLTAAAFASGITDNGGNSGALTENVMNALRILDFHSYDTASYVYTNNFVLTKTVELTVNEVLTLKVVPKVLITSPGANMYIEVISAVGKLAFDSAAYEAGTDKLEIKYAGGSTMFEFENAFLESASTVVDRAKSTADSVLKVGNVVLDCATQPTTGDGIITIVLTYRIHYLP